MQLPTVKPVPPSSAEGEAKPAADGRQTPSPAILDAAPSKSICTPPARARLFRFPSLVISLGIKRKCRVYGARSNSPNLCRERDSTLKPGICLKTLSPIHKSYSRFLSMIKKEITTLLLKREQMRWQELTKCHIIC